MAETTQAESHEEGGIAESVWMHGSPWQPTAMWGVTFGVMFVLLALGLSAKKKTPGLLQNAWEFAYEWVYDNSYQVVGAQGMAYFPLFLCIFLYVFFNNLLGLIPFMASATASINTTLALALVTALATHGLAIKKKGFGHAMHYFQVVDFRTGDNLMAKAILFMLQFFLLPVIEIIGAVAQPISLAARLFGNIFAKETILAVLAAMLVSLAHSPALMDKGLMLLPLALRPAIIILGVLVSLIQAIVFTVLSMVYISNATASHDEHHEEEGHGAAPAH
jgi:F-type H+-transporting ATPase subunit a